MFEQLIHEAALRHGLDPRLFHRQIQAESGGNPNAVSAKGATGLGQLMPGTARAMGVTDPRDPAQNIEGAAGYMEKMLAQAGGDPRRALAAYNWGPGNLAKAGGDVRLAPAETQAYLSRILGGGGAVGNMQASAQNLPTPPMPPDTPTPPAETGAAPGPTAPGTAPELPSERSNQQNMAMAVAQGGLRDRGTLSSLIMGLPGAGPPVAARNFGMA